MLDALLSPEFLPYMLVGVATMVLAIWLMVLDAASPVNRVFAAFLFFRSLSLILGTQGDVAEAAGDARMALFWLSTYAYLTIPLFGILLYFVSVYPHRRGIFGTTIWGPWVLLGATIALMAWYAVDHDIYWRMFWFGEIEIEDGPLGILAGLRLPMLAVVGWILSRDYQRNPHGSGGYSTFLIAAGFTVNALFDGLLFTTRSAFTIERIGMETWVSYSYPALYATFLCLPIAIGALVHMARAMPHESQDATLQEARRMMFFIVPITILAGGMTGYLETIGQIAALEFIRGVWNLAVPATITYALMRYSLFDVDIRLKAGMRRAIILVSFATVFFIVSEAAENVFASERGLWFGIAAASLLAAGGRPLRAIAARAADAIMPDTVPLHMLSPRRREALYHDQFLLVGADGQVTHKERNMLTALADALRISEAQAHRLETTGEVQGDDTAPVSSSPAGPVRMTRSRHGVVAVTTALLFGGISAVLEALVPGPNLFTGLLSAAAITLLLGPIERFISRIGRPPRPIDPAARTLYQTELAAAIADGNLSRRDRRYLHGLAEHLGIEAQVRRSMDREATRRLSAGLRAAALAD